MQNLGTNDRTMLMIGQNLSVNASSVLIIIPSAGNFLQVECIGE
jgi:hypothetical protein